MTCPAVASDLTSKLHGLALAELPAVRGGTAHLPAAPCSLALWKPGVPSPPCIPPPGLLPCACWKMSSYQPQALPRGNPSCSLWNLCMWNIPSLPVGCWARGIYFFRGHEVVHPVTWLSPLTCQFLEGAHRSYSSLQTPQHLGLCSEHLSHSVNVYV